MSIDIPEPLDYLLPDEMDEWRDIRACIDALPVTSDVPFEQAKALHFRQLLFLSSVYSRHARLNRGADIIISPYTGAITYEEVHIDMETA